MRLAMVTTNRLLVGAILLIATLLAASLPSARAQEPYRVRGTLKSVAADQLVITSREGEVMGFPLSPELGVFVVTPATIDDVKQGQYVGLATVMSGDRQVALEAHLFADDLRGLGEGHFPWDLVKEPNMMTNATVAQVKDAGADRELDVSYQEGGAKVAGAQTIYLPPDVPIVHMAKADRSLLAPGKAAVLLVRPERDLTPVVIAAVVGDQGAGPQMWSPARPPPAGHGGAGR
jgi:hypothetical protein